MIPVSVAAPLPVLVPLFVAILVWLVRPSSLFVRLLALLAACSPLPLLYGLLQLEPTQVALGGWAPPLGIRLVADGVSVLFLLFHSAVALTVALVTSSGPGVKSGAKDARTRLFWSLFFIAWTGLNALALSRDLFNLYVVLELISLTSVGLILLTGTAAAVRAAINYLLLAVVGGLLYLLGVGFLYASANTLDLEQIGAALTPGPLAEASLVLLLTGLIIKSALFPVHTWLPPAHANARPPISALLSGLVVTAAYLVILRLWTSGFEALAPSPLPGVLSTLGATSIVWGGWMALRQDRLKRVLAYSTVSQTGYLFLVYGLAERVPSTTSDLWAGAVALALGHGLSKAAAFLAAGMLADLRGSDRLEDLRGVATQHPVPVALFVVATANLVGLPPGLGFLGKWIYLNAAFDQAQWGLGVAILAGSLLSVAYLMRPLETMLNAVPLGPKDDAPPLESLPALAVLFLALLPFVLSWWLSGENSLLRLWGPFATQESTLNMLQIVGSSL